MNLLHNIKDTLLLHATLTQEAATRFFKTSPGSYSAHDTFLGVTVPNIRKIAKIYQYLELDIIEQLLIKSEYNEERLLALFILVHQYQKGNTDCQEKLVQFYLSNLIYVNNWNLVDASAHHILGHYLWNKERSLLNTLATSNILWECRVAIVATLYFIRKGDTTTTFQISTLLLNHKHDLIHKAVGWMLREAGKKDIESLIQFLSLHKEKMPRTMFRYATEKLSESQKILL